MGRRSKDPADRRRAYEERARAQVPDEPFRRRTIAVAAMLFFVVFFGGQSIIAACSPPGSGKRTTPSDPGIEGPYPGVVRSCEQRPRLSPLDGPQYTCVVDLRVPTDDAVPAAPRAVYAVQQFEPDDIGDSFDVLVGPGGDMTSYDRVAIRPGYERTETPFILVIIFLYVPGCGICFAVVLGGLISRFDGSRKRPQHPGDVR